MAGKKPATKTISEAEANDPATILRSLSGVESGSGGDHNGFAPNIVIPVDIPVAEVNINGFQTQIARDLYFRDGDIDVAQQAEELSFLIGENLYEKAAIAAKCSGKDDVAEWLRFRIWEELEKLLDPVEDLASLIKAIPEELREERDKETDEDPASPINALIKKHLGGSNLGRVRQAASLMKVSNRTAIQALIVNHLKVLYHGRGL